LTALQQPAGQTNQGFAHEWIHFHDTHQVLLDTAGIIERRKPGCRLARAAQEWTFLRTCEVENEILWLQ
jgi:hypothetical protein